MPEVTNNLTADQLTVLEEVCTQVEAAMHGVKFLYQTQLISSAEATECTQGLRTVINRLSSKLHH